MTITEFILSRVAEDEKEATTLKREWEECPPSAYDAAQVGALDAGDPERVLAECEAKRTIVALGPSECGGHADQIEFGGHHYPDPEWAFCDGCSAAAASDGDWQKSLRALAAIWSNHADYDEGWR